MINWLNKQNYFLLSVMVTSLFSIGIIIGGILFGLPANQSFTAGVILGLLCLTGFLIVRFTMPDLNH